MDKIHQLDRKLSRNPRVVELAMVLVAVLVTWLLFTLPRHRHVILYLYFLPVSLSGFYLGRYRSGVMAFFSVAAVAIASTVSSDGVPVVTGVLAGAVWGAVLGLTSLLTGTVSDERRRHLDQVRESHRVDTLKDALTEVANRRAFDYEMKRRVAELHRQGSFFALVILDIDHFKHLNDTHGHLAGDAVIRGVAQTLEEIMRELDLVARYGGEEFAIVLPKSTLVEAKDAAERARSKIESSRFAFQKLRLKVTVSVGVVQAAKGESCEAIISRADAALYTSKNAGRNCSTFHNGEACEPFGQSLTCALVEESRNLVVDVTAVEAYWDRETNLPSRRVFVEDLRRRVAESQRHRRLLSLALIEIDGLRKMQHETPNQAQQLLAVIGDIVCDVMRDADLVARFSLSQFAVSMPSTQLEGAMVPTERLQQLIAQAVKQSPVDITVSVGLAELQPDEDAVSLLERADLAIQREHRSPSLPLDTVTSGTAG